MCGAAMRFFKTFGQALQALCRLVGLGGAHDTAIAADFGSPRVAGAPAVAGFVMRAHVDRCYLASRLASVAKLNTPVGRKPAGAARRSTGLPPVPAERIGAKKTRLDGNRGPRVLRTVAVSPTKASNVIAFPVKSADQHQQRLAAAA